MSREGVDARIEVLKRAEIFLGLEDSQLLKIASLPSCHIQHCKNGEGIFREGEVAAALYVLAEGEVKLAMKVPADSPYASGQAVVDRVTKGGVFGWSALVAPHILTLSACCTKDTKILVIGGTDLNELLDKEPRLGYEIMKGLVRVIGSRLRDTRRLLIAGKRAVIR